MKRARITKELKEMGIPIIRVRGEDKKSFVGIHLLGPTQTELEDAIYTSQRDQGIYTAIYIHTFGTRASGSIKRS